MTISYPAKLADVTNTLRDYGWSYMLNHGQDTGGSPFISVEARRGNLDVRITWHTRGDRHLSAFLVHVQQARREPD